MAGLLYLQHAFKLSAEAVVARWVEHPYYQHFTGETFFQHRPPIDPSSLSRWRGRIGEEGVEWMPTKTIEAGLTSGAVGQKSLERIAVDTTVMGKAIAHPTDARLHERARVKLVALAREADVPLRQSHARLASRLAMQAGRYAHTRQFRCMRKALRRLKGYVGRVRRDIQAWLASRGQFRRLRQQRRRDVARPPQERLNDARAAGSGRPRRGPMIDRIVGAVDTPQMRRALRWVRDVGRWTSEAARFPIAGGPCGFSLAVASITVLQMRIAVQNAFPNLSVSAEREFMARVHRVGADLGWDIRDMVTSDDTLGGRPEAHVLPADVPDGVLGAGDGGQFQIETLPETVDQRPPTAAPAPCAGPTIGNRAQALRPQAGPLPA